MNQHLQKNAFLEFEADQWFKRNHEKFIHFDAEKDRVISLIKTYNLKPSRVLEIGCSAGYRLNGIKQNFSSIEVFGVDPSQDAIRYGKLHYKDVNFIHGTVDDMSYFEDSSFDTVIIGFVFYVVDRILLLRAISEIDRILKDKGFLIIIDFFGETNLKRNYAHIRDLSAFVFKQKYDDIFSATLLYHLIDKSCENHISSFNVPNGDLQNLVSISLLKKDLDASYIK